MGRGSRWLRKAFQLYRLPSPGWSSAQPSWIAVLFKQDSPVGNRCSYWQDTHACCQPRSSRWAAHICCRTDEPHANGGEPEPRNTKTGAVSLAENVELICHSGGPSIQSNSKGNASPFPVHLLWIVINYLNLKETIWTYSSSLWNRNKRKQVFKCIRNYLKFM